MERRAVRIAIFLGVLLVVLTLFGWLGFMFLVGVSPGKALTGTINIISSVGLGDPPSGDSEVGALIVAVLQLGSVTIVALAVASLSQVIILGAFKQYMGRKRMDERIKNLNNHLIITGYSLTGASLARDLIAESQQFVVIEKDPDKITMLESNDLLYIEGDATDETILSQAGVERAKGLFSVLSSDSDNLMVVLSARGLNQDLKIVSRCTRDDYVSRFHRAGADAAISPQEWASKRMSQAVLRPHLLQLLSSLLDPAVSHAYLDEVTVPENSSIVGKTLADSGIRQESGIVILGIVRGEGDCESSPGPDTVLEADNVLIGFGQRQNFANLRKFLAR